jgi:hypothetical protein
MRVTKSFSRTMAQAVSRRPLTAEARVRSRVSPCETCGGQVALGQVFPPSTSVFSCKFHSSGAPLQGKTKTRIIFTTGLHKKPQGCGASVAFAAGPFIPLKKKIKSFTSTVSFNPLNNYRTFYKDLFTIQDTEMFII